MSLQCCKGIDRGGYETVLAEWYYATFPVEAQLLELLRDSSASEVTSRTDHEAAVFLMAKFDFVQDCFDKARQDPYMKIVLARMNRSLPSMSDRLRVDFGFWVKSTTWWKERAGEIAASVKKNRVVKTVLSA